MLWIVYAPKIPVFIIKADSQESARKQLLTGISDTGIAELKLTEQLTVERLTEKALAIVMENRGYDEVMLDEDGSF